MTPAEPTGQRDQAPHDWCPECDGPGQCQPGLCCGRPYPELREAEVIARGRAEINLYLVSLLAEYDRRGERIAAVLAECDRYERGGDVIMRTGRIRALLGEERP